MASVYTNLYYNQPIVVLDTTSATPTSGSLVLYGGFAARGASYLSGITYIVNSTESNDTSSGSLIVSGGVGIQKNLNVKGNTNIIGSITAASIKTTLINSTNGFFTNFTTSNFQADYVRSVAITSGAIIATQGTFSTVTSSFISVDTMSAGSIFLSGDLAVAGTITSVHITSTNIIETNVTAGVVYVTDTFSAIGGSNTVGSIYTTGGNIGLNNTEPGYLLDVNGTSNFTDVLLANNGITTGTLHVTGASLLSGNVTIGSNLIVSGPSLKIPIGDIANRPAAPEAGFVRYNTETSQFEGYGPGSAWGSLGGVVDIAQTTKILASGSPSTTDGNLYFYTVGSERMRVNSAGNIGINTSAPSYLLDVVGTLGASIGITTGSLNVTGASTLHGNLTVDGPGLRVPTGNIASRPAVPEAGHVRYNTETSQFEGYGPGSAWGSLGGVVDIAQTTKILPSASASVTDGNLYFYTVGSERMRLNSAGNIGINTSAPNYLLDVAGTLGVTIGITTGSLNVTGASTLHGDLTVDGPGLRVPTGNIAARPAVPEAGHVRYNTETSQFEGYGPGSAWGSLGGVVDIAQTTKILASASPSTTDGNLYFYTVGSERMRVNSAGNIGIGTTSPSYKLDINGTLGASTSISTGNLYASSSLVTNTIDMTPSLGDIIKEVSFSAENNQLSLANITNLAFPNNTVRSFSAIVSVCIMKSTGTNLYANFDIKGIQKDIGDWAINTNFIGDNTGIVFTVSNVNSKGQIQYISEDLSNWVSTTFKFKATTTSI